MSRARLIDLTLVGTRYEVMKAALDILTTAPEFDLVVVVVGSSARFYPDLAVRPIIDSAGAAKPIAAFLVPEAPQARVALGKAGVANFYTPEACADAVAAALLAPASAAASGDCACASPGAGRPLDELEAYGVLDRLGVPRAPSLALDISAPPPSLPFGYPVAVKVLCGGDFAQIRCRRRRARHRRCTLRSPPRWRRCAAKLPQARRVLVQPMIAGVGEVLIGYRVDPDAGPLVMLAAGGIYTEIYRDRSLRLAPVDLATAREMIARCAGSRRWPAIAASRRAISPPLLRRWWRCPARRRSDRARGRGQSADGASPRRASSRSMRWPAGLCRRKRRNVEQKHINPAWTRQFQ